MSEWFIEQPSTFGGAGGCFVECLSMVGGIALIVGLMCYLPQEKNKKNQDNPVKVESVKQNTRAIPQDTISFVPVNDAVFRDIEKQYEFLLQKTARDLNVNDAVFRDIEKQHEFLLQKTARDLNEVESLSRMRGYTR